MKVSQKSQLVTSTKGNTKTLVDTRCRRWCFTFNNYTDAEFRDTVTFCEKNCIDYRIGKEKGEEGTPHLQGFFVFKNAIRFSSLKNKLSQISLKFHIEKMKGNIKQNITYCEKDNNFIKPLSFTEKIEQDILKEEYLNIKWYEWQKRILEIMNEKPDRRIIYFIVDSKGNSGKSFLCKYILLTYKGCVIADGKKDNIFNQIKDMLENEIEPKYILLDIPRHNIDYLNYGAIEQIKNGFIYSGKYEGGRCIFHIPHVFIFMNERPLLDKLSIDRYKIIKCGN